MLTAADRRTDRHIRPHGEGNEAVHKATDSRSQASRTTKSTATDTATRGGQRGCPQDKSTDNRRQASRTSKSPPMDTGRWSPHDGCRVWDQFQGRSTPSPISRSCPPTRALTVRRARPRQKGIIRVITQPHSRLLFLSPPPLLVIGWQYSIRYAIHK